MFKIINNRRRLSIGLMVLTIILLLFTLYFSFSFADLLIYDRKVLSLSDYHLVTDDFILIIILNGLTLLLTIYTMIFLYRNDQSRVVYVEKRNDDGMDEKELAVTAANSFLSNTAADILGGKTSDPFQPVLNYLCGEVKAVHGVVFTKKGDYFTYKCGFAITDPDIRLRKFTSGEGISGQAVEDNAPRFIKGLENHFPEFVSGLGKATPDGLLAIPLSDVMGSVQAIVELAVLSDFTEKKIDRIASFCADWGQLVEFDNSIEEEPSQEVTEPTKKKKK